MPLDNSPTVARRLAGVHGDLVRLITEAAARHQLVVRVTEGVRAAERQKELVASGASRTMDSRHITGHAVDVAIMLGKEVRWDFGLYQDFADTVAATSLEIGIPIIWGGHWGQLKDGDQTEEIAAYVARCRAQGRRPLLDGPHYELPRDLYPAPRTA